jgi:hypothetical protein
MSAHAAILLLCPVLGMSGVAIFWLATKLLSAREDLSVEKLAHADTAETLARSTARINELETVGSEMYLELQSKAYQAESSSYIVTCLEGRLANLISHAASMNAKRFAEEKKAVGASIVELLLAFFFPASCGRTGAV